MTKTSLSFDAQKFAREHGIAPEILNKMIEEIRREFPDDEMMFELHLIRVILHESGKV